MERDPQGQPALACNCPPNVPCQHQKNWFTLCKIAGLGGLVRCVCVWAWCRAARPKFRCAKEMGMDGGSHDGICVMLPVRVDTCAGSRHLRGV